jgi:hypothetical protein
VGVLRTFPYGLGKQKTHRSFVYLTAREHKLVIRPFDRRHSAKGGHLIAYLLQPVGNTFGPAESMDGAETILDVQAH